MPIDKGRYKQREATISSRGLWLLAKLVFPFGVIWWGCLQYRWRLRTPKQWIFCETVQQAIPVSAIVGSLFVYSSPFLEFCTDRTATWALHYRSAATLTDLFRASVQAVQLQRNTLLAVVTPICFWVVRSFRLDCTLLGTDSHWGTPWEPFDRNSHSCCRTHSDEGGTLLGLPSRLIDKNLCTFSWLYKTGELRLLANRTMGYPPMNSCMVLDMEAKHNWDTNLIIVPTECRQ